MRFTSILGDHLRDRGPIQILPALRQQGQKPVVNQTRNRQWHAQRLPCLQHQPIVFESERSGETCGLKLAINDKSAIDLVNRRGEQSRC